MRIEQLGNQPWRVVGSFIGLLVLIFASLSVGQTTTTQPAPIKVGLTVSQLTGITKGPSGNPWGYNSQVRPVREIKSSDIEFYPIIEDGTDQDASVAAVLKRDFPDRKPVSAKNIDEVKKFDVIVTCECWMGSDELLKALHESVSSGTSLLTIGGIGWATPGFRNQNEMRPTQLAGLEDAQGGYTEQAVQCEVVFEHAILGNLKAGQSLQLRPLGAFGLLPADMQPLVKVSDMSLVKTRGPAVNNPDFTFLPIYVSHLEKGKIIGIQCAIGAMNKNDRDDLIIRSIRFLAGRKVN